MKLILPLLGCQKGKRIEPHIYYALALLLASFLVITAGRFIVRLLVWVSLVKVGQSRWGCIAGLRICIKSKDD